MDLLGRILLRPMAPIFDVGAGQVGNPLLHASRQRWDENPEAEGLENRTGITFELLGQV